MVDSKREMLSGVVRMVALTPREAKILAISIIGIWWPGDMKGTKNTCSCSWSWIFVEEGASINLELNKTQEIVFCLRARVQ